MKLTDNTLQHESTALAAVNCIVGFCVLVECVIRVCYRTSVMSFYLFPVFVLLGVRIFHVAAFAKTLLVVRYSSVI